MNNSTESKQRINLIDKRIKKKNRKKNHLKTNINANSNMIQRKPTLLQQVRINVLI